MLLSVQAASVRSTLQQSLVRLERSTTGGDEQADGEERRMETSRRVGRMSLL